METWLRALRTMIYASVGVATGAGAIILFPVSIPLAMGACVAGLGVVVGVHVLDEVVQAQFAKKAKYEQEKHSELQQLIIDEIERLSENSNKNQNAILNVIQSASRQQNSENEKNKSFQKKTEARVNTLEMAVENNKHSSKDSSFETASVQPKAQSKAQSQVNKSLAENKNCKVLEKHGFLQSANKSAFEPANDKNDKANDKPDETSCRKKTALRV